MNRTLRNVFVHTVAASALLITVAAVPAPAAAQELFTFTASALGGIGGAFDVERGDGVGNPSYQLGFSVVKEPRTLVGVRLGRVDFGNDRFGDLFNADLTYLTVAGEYRFEESFYDSGLYLGLGGYQLQGTRLGGSSGDRTAIGLAFGVTGEFTLTRRVGILVELSGHYADLDQAKFFGLGHAGVAFHF